MNSKRSYTHLFIIACLSFFAIQAQMTHGLRGINIVLRLDGERVAPRMLTSIDAGALDTTTRKNPAMAPSSSLDPNRTSKRRVRRGSDPIHNRC
ncbi:hypothetical protein IHE45_05G217000 [Dioscorea alata]|uniref:Uncharacterized protein n=1 Tax=Dioscorea alata TaxID=55571 RepID=A0ACB7W945_DIOAL|nr:hypothetical protein IHE45_05G217000 [Dioscorea alata]